MFQCQNLYRTDTQLTFLETDYNIQCWSETHTLWSLGLAIPAIIFWAFILPAPLFLFMKKHKTELYTQEYASRYSFLYRGYKKEIYFWEMLIFLRKYCLIFIVSLSTFISSEIQIYISLYIIWIALSLQSKYNPYQLEKLNYLESVSLICAAVINSTGLYFKFIKKAPSLSYIILIVAVIANCYFLLIWLKQYLAMLKKKPTSTPGVRKSKTLFFWQRNNKKGSSEAEKGNGDEISENENNKENIDEQTKILVETDSEVRKRRLSENLLLLSSHKK